MKEARDSSTMKEACSNSKVSCCYPLCMWYFVVLYVGNGHSAGEAYKFYNVFKQEYVIEIIVIKTN